MLRSAAIEKNSTSTLRRCHSLTAFHEEMSRNQLPEWMVLTPKKCVRSVSAMGTSERKARAHSSHRYDCGEGERTTGRRLFARGHHNSQFDLEHKYNLTAGLRLFPNIKARRTSEKARALLGSHVLRNILPLGPVTSDNAAMHSNSAPWFSKKKRGQSAPPAHVAPHSPDSCRKRFLTIPSQRVAIRGVLDGMGSLYSRTQTSNTKNDSTFVASCMNQGIPSYGSLVPPRSSSAHGHGGEHSNRCKSSRKRAVSCRDAVLDGKCSGSFRSGVTNVKREAVQTAGNSALVGELLTGSRRLFPGRTHTNTSKRVEMDVCEPFRSPESDEAYAFFQRRQTIETPNSAHDSVGTVKVVENFITQNYHPVRQRRKVERSDSDGQIVQHLLPFGPMRKNPSQDSKITTEFVGHSRRRPHVLYPHADCHKFTISRIMPCDESSLVTLRSSIAPNHHSTSSEKIRSRSTYCNAASNPPCTTLNSGSGITSCSELQVPGGAVVDNDDEGVCFSPHMIRRRKYLYAPRSSPADGGMLMASPRSRSNAHSAAMYNAKKYHEKQQERRDRHRPANARFSDNPNVRSSIVPIDAHEQNTDRMLRAAVKQNPLSAKEYAELLARETNSKGIMKRHNEASRQVTQHMTDLKTAVLLSKTGFDVSVPRTQRRHYYSQL